MTEFLEIWKKYFTWAAVYSCFINILSLTFSFYMFAIYRNIVMSYSGYSLANITSAAMIALTALCLFLYVRSRLLARAGIALNTTMREQVFEVMLRSSVVDPKRSYQTGLLDLGTLQSYVSTPAVNGLFDAPWIPFYLALIFSFDPVLGMIATGGAVLMTVLAMVQELMIKKPMARANQINTENHGFVSSFMRNAEVTVGMGMIGNITGRFVSKNNELMENQTRASNTAGIVQAMTKPLQNSVQVMIYCFGAYYGITKGFDPGLMVVCSIMMGRALGPLMQVTGSWRQTVGARTAYLRIRGLSEFSNQRTPEMLLPPPKGALQVDRAVFGVPGRFWLKGVSFSLNPGEFLGIIGPSGAGKTTLCRLLLGIWPCIGDGKVYLDGRDIYAWSKEEIGPYMGYLPQEVELFPGTVAENIARLSHGNPEDIEGAVKESGCGPLIDALPLGVETRIEGDSGIRLSGGQKQRIGLARALYGNPKFLVLDEPTSNMDEAGERQLLEALANIKRGGKCTCIMVTHKPALLQAMDKILVVRNGLTAAFGPKNEVMAQLAGGASVGSESPVKGVPAAEGI